MKTRKSIDESKLVGKKYSTLPLSYRVVISFLFSLTASIIGFIAGPYIVKVFS